MEDAYRCKTVAKLASKRLWSVAATFVGDDVALQTGLLRQMVEDGDLQMAQEYRVLFGLPESALVIDPEEARVEEARRREHYVQVRVGIKEETSYTAFY